MSGTRKDDTDTSPRKDDTDTSPRKDDTDTSPRKDDTDTTDSGKTVDSVCAEIKKEFDISGKANNALKEIKKQEEYKEILKDAKSLEEALKIFKNVEDLEKFQSVFKKEYDKAQEKTHMQRFWWVYTLGVVAVIGLIAYLFFMKKPSEKETEEEE